MKTPSSFIKWTLWILAASFYFYEFSLRVSPGVMIPELMQSFQITASSVGILSAFYLYAYAPMQLPAGILLDRHGIKTILTLASITCGIGALLFSMANRLETACVGRLLIGASSAFAFIALVYVSSQWFAPQKRAFLIGSANSIAMFGASVGMGPLTTVIHRIGWRETTGILGVFGIFLGLAVFFILTYDRTAVLPLQQNGFFVHLKQVASRQSSWINATAALLFYITTTAFGGLWGLSFVQTAYGVSKETAGYAISMIFAGWMIGGPMMGWISDRLKNRIFAIQSGILGALACLLLVIYMPGLPIHAVYALLFFLGLFSSAELLNFSLAIELNSPAAKATAAAFTNCLISCGDAIVQPFIGLLLDLNWNGKLIDGIRFYDTFNYQIALFCLPIALGIAFFLMLYLKKRYG